MFHDDDDQRPTPTPHCKHCGQILAGCPCVEHPEDTWELSGKEHDDSYEELDFEAA